jgi:Ca2+-transporting ATPase
MRRMLTKVPHAAGLAELVAALGGDLEAGLSAGAVAEALARSGPNRIEEGRATSSWARLFAQFRQLMVVILIVAGTISAWLGQLPDAIAIAAIVVLNALLGFVQEERAARAVEALRHLSTPDATVIREGHRQTIPARDVVPGDLIELDAGDLVPADARLVSAFGLHTQESALTGESQTVLKDAGPMLDLGTPLAERANMVYQGTMVAAGRANALVTATGMSTELGQIAGLLERTESGPTPLQRRMSELGRVLVIVCLVTVAVISVLLLARGGNLLQVFLLSVSLAVAAVPEGLPAVVTVALALGLQRLARRKALVRRLPSVETLGSVTVICTDKTGTITQNEMTVREVVAGGQRYRVSGTGYAPRGRFLRVAGARDLGPRNAEAAPGDDPALDDSRPVDPASEPDLLALLTIGARCSHAQLVPEEVGDGMTWRAIGDPTEAALVSAALKGGVERANQDTESLFEIPFEAERRMMTVVVEEPGTRTTAYTKGAPEALLPRCTEERWHGAVRPLTDARRHEILAEGAAFAGRALRVLAFADRAHAARTTVGDERELVFAGLAGLHDPPRPEARSAVATCLAAGIRPVMITGDHPETALAVAREVGIAGPGSVICTGRELDDMTGEDLAGRVARIAVFARVSAAHKLRVVEALQAQGQVVAMTGDGVNDAPSVQAADIGIAMGRTGTDVTREAADMVLLDDHFATIVAAVEEGRGIFDNIRKFVHYLLATNAGEVLLMLVAVLLGWPVPLLATQILWINLVTDGLPALALGLEPPERDLMSRPPRPPHARTITRADGLLILLRGALVMVVAAAGFAWAHGGDPERLPHARAMAFSITAYAQLFYAFAFRSWSRTLPEIGLFSNRPLLVAVVVAAALQFLVVELPFVRSIFGVERPVGGDWWVVAVLALTPVTLIEVAKLVRRRR